MRLVVPLPKTMNQDYYNLTKYIILMYNREAFLDLKSISQEIDGSYYEASGIDPEYYCNVYHSQGQCQVTCNINQKEKDGIISVFRYEKVFETGIPRQLINNPNAVFIVDKNTLIRAKLNNTPNSHRMVYPAGIVFDKENRRKCLGHFGVVKFN
ncbi:MAG: hypothetical protein F6K53_20330 [Moorea sp. SIO4A1]|uniref:hypothetical protein n=1 Tax=Moorena sp. SIO4A1 TaxID=2607835 RepID=UPI00144F8B48|nr:hypothetical protein [Moorena sp. SIO4A1]NEQ59620.1 hypothetical protein [Moorena sp. SIO4A1]